MKICNVILFLTCYSCSISIYTSPSPSPLPPPSTHLLIYPCMHLSIEKLNTYSPPPPCFPCTSFPPIPFPSCHSSDHPNSPNQIKTPISNSIKPKCTECIYTIWVSHLRTIDKQSLTPLSCVYKPSSHIPSV